MFCNKCGANVQEGAKMCNKCGAVMPSKEKCSGFADILSFNSNETPKSHEMSGALKSFDSADLENNIKKLSKKTDMVMQATRKAYLFSVISLALSIIIMLVTILGSISSGNKTQNKTQNKTENTSSKTVSGEVEKSKDSKSGSNKPDETEKTNECIKKVAEQIAQIDITK